MRIVTVSLILATAIIGLLFAISFGSQSADGDGDVLSSIGFSGAEARVLVHKLSFPEPKAGLTA